MLSATAAAEPPEDPPATLAVSRGLRTGPYMLFSLLAPCPNASQLFFPSKTPPCFLVGAFNDKSVHPSNSLRFYEALLEKGHRVICVDNLFTGRKENIAHLLKNKNFEFIEHDIIEPLFLKKSIDQIYNLACPASPVHYQHNAIRTIKANTVGMINMLGMAKKHKARILQASTSEVYGDPKEHPQKESYWGNVNCTGVRSCYDEGKRVAETLMLDYHRQNKVDIRIARIFNTYGPRMHPNDGRVVSNFVVQALKGEPITLYGEGNQTRSFCYVDDLVEAFLRFMATGDDVTGPINLGNPGEFTILELATMVKELTGSKSEIVFQPLPQDDPVRRRPDITLAKAKLHWEPTIPLRDGLSRTVAFFRELLAKG